MHCAESLLVFGGMLFAASDVFGANLESITANKMEEEEAAVLMDIKSTGRKQIVN